MIFEDVRGNLIVAKTVEVSFFWFLVRGSKANERV